MNYNTEALRKRWKGSFNISVKEALPLLDEIDLLHILLDNATKLAEKNADSADALRASNASLATQLSTETKLAEERWGEIQGWLVHVDKLRAQLKEARGVARKFYSLFHYCPGPKPSPSEMSSAAAYVRLWDYEGK